MLWHEVLADGAAGWEARLRAALTEQAANAPDDVKRLRADVDAAAKRVENAKKNLAEVPNDLLASVVEGLRKMEARHRQLQARLADVQRHAKKVQDVDKAVKEATKKLCGIAGMMTGQREWDADFIRREVKSIEISWHEVEVTTPRRGTCTRSVPASIVLTLNPESLVGAEALAVFFGHPDDMAGHMQTDRRSRAPPAIC